MTRREGILSVGGLCGASLVAKRSFADGAEALPSFWKSRLGDVDFALSQVKKDRVRLLAKSAGQRNLHLVTYGHRDNLASTANYNSACGRSKPRPEVGICRDESLPSAHVALHSSDGREAAKEGLECLGCRMFSTKVRLAGDGEDSCDCASFCPNVREYSATTLESDALV